MVSSILAVKEKRECSSFQRYPRTTRRKEARDTAVAEKQRGTIRPLIKSQIPKILEIAPPTPIPPPLCLPYPPQGGTIPWQPLGGVFSHVPTRWRCGAGLGWKFARFPTVARWAGGAGKRPSYLGELVWNLRLNLNEEMGLRLGQTALLPRRGRRKSPGQSVMSPWFESQSHSLRERAHSPAGIRLSSYLSKGLITPCWGKRRLSQRWRDCGH